eukprot:TRINITY_DN31610_c0_g1_i1.p1 TRINITY_DN31610_c0_g1~~TRINITY_DN31610_c0_g1_i1.p1  ORF type:complete len:421 (-),score=98.28 TRINITY_DN31610_c0_g1_i1:337-1599(-)
MAKYFRKGSRSSMMVLGGTSHPELTAKIARKVGVKIGKIDLGKFKNGETAVMLQDNVRDKDIYIIQTGGVRSNDAIIELLLMINACKLASAASITLITPYYPYSKGDQKSSLRSPITSKLLANMIQKSGAEHIMMLDPHSPQLVGFFDIPVDSLKVEPLFCTWITNNIPNWRECTVVSPDEGSAKRSTMIANYLELEFAMIHNRHKKTISSRKLSREQTPAVDLEPPGSDVSLKLTYRMVERLMKISGEVEGCDCILVDDMIDTGSTMQLALDVLRAHGAGKVYIFAAHGVFSGDAFENLIHAENLEKVVVTNSIPQETSRQKLGSLLEVVDISGIISEYIRRCHYNESVSVLSDVGGEFDTKDQLLRSLVRQEMERERHPENEEAAGGGCGGGGAEGAGPGLAVARVRRGYRLDSICWD